MAKKQKQQPEQFVKQAQQPVVESQIPVAQPKSWSINDFKVQAVIVALLAFVFYFNSFFNEFAHDDGIVIVKNEYVLEGFSGIWSILTKDAYDSYYRQLNTTNQLSGGRYRPLSIVTFAIEQQFLGAVSVDRVDSVLKQNISYGVTGPDQQKLVNNMHVRHVVNVLIFMLSMVVLLYFFRYIVFKDNPLMAFIAAILFTIHPIHTEVIANVKSRDEIMSLLFMCLTFIYTFKYMEHKKIGTLIAALLCYFLAFLSKEYAITMIVLLPLSLYIFGNYSIKKSILAFLPFVLVLAAYFAIRLSIVAAKSDSSDNEVLNNPYLFASVSEKLATEISTSLNYLKLLIFPYPLSADYSYNTIPYVDFTNLKVWLSLIVHGGMVITGIVLFQKIIGLKSEAAKKAKMKIAGVVSASERATLNTASIFLFAIVFYFLHLLLVCNIVFDIGATMGERLIYHSSVGFVIAAAWLLVKGMEKIKDPTIAKAGLIGVMTVIIVLFGIQTMARNAAWKNDATLFSTDIKTVPNSVLVNANVAASYITIADYQKTDSARRKYLYDAINILNHTLSIHRTFVAGFLNRGIAWYKLGDVDRARPNIDTVRSLYPNYPTLPGMYKLMSDYYLKNGWESYGKNGKYPEAIEEYKKGLKIDSTNVDLWYNMGGAYYTNKQYPEAAGAFQKALKISPNNQQAQNGLNATIQALNGGQAQKK